MKISVTLCCCEEQSRLEQLIARVQRAGMVYQGHQAIRTPGEGPGVEIKAVIEAPSLDMAAKSLVNELGHRSVDNVEVTMVYNGLSELGRA